MKAIVLRAHGGIEQLTHQRDYPEPELRERHALVRIRATSVNRIDLVVREGYPGVQIPFPHIPGADIAGVVERVGLEVRGFREGDRVLSWPLVACGSCAMCRGDRRWLCLEWKYFGLHLDGSYAEYIAVPEENLIPLPAEISFEVAATLPVAGLTAYHALVTVGQVEAGETVLLWGGSGGLGTFSVQLARELGAHVIATVGKDEKRERVASLGADLVLNHYRDDVVAAVREFTRGQGVEVVLDSVGAQTFPKGFQLLQKGGRLLLCGKLTGMDVPLSLHQTYLRHVSILGLYLGEKRELAELLRWVREGRIAPVIDRTFKLEEASQAHRVMASGDHLGKLVLLP
jgi:NADPH:quinone reductase-like Zn-dependent oxidoreductase